MPRNSTADSFSILISNYLFICLLFIYLFIHFFMQYQDRHMYSKVKIQKSKLIFQGYYANLGDIN